MPWPSRIIEANGLRLTQHEWALRTGLSDSVIANRITRGMDPARAVTTPRTDPHAHHGRSTRVEIEPGTRFGRLVVLDLFGRDEGRKALWLCECNCGNVVAIQGKRLRNGASASCGCARLEANRRPKTHGATCGGHRTPEWRAWIAMFIRCRYRSQSHWNRYGGRGIKVCARWTGRDGFAHFLADMGKHPGPQHSLDRYPDNDGNYEPSNCRWATASQQTRNSSHARIIEVDGVRRHLVDWARLYKLNPATISGRLAKGWSPARAVARIKH